MLAPPRDDKTMAKLRKAVPLPRRTNHRTEDQLLAHPTDAYTGGAKINKTIGLVSLHTKPGSCSPQPSHSVGPSTSKLVLWHRLRCVLNVLVSVRCAHPLSHLQRQSFTRTASPSALMSFNIARTHTKKVAAATRNDFSAEHPPVGGCEPKPYSILNTNSCVAKISVASAVHLYCIIAALTAAWKTRGPERMVTSLTMPSLTNAWALTIPSEPS